MPFVVRRGGLAFYANVLGNSRCTEPILNASVVEQVLSMSIRNDPPPPSLSTTSLSLSK